MHGPVHDRFRQAPPQKWERARRLALRRWVGDVEVDRTVAAATCQGLVGARVRVDLATGASRCTCSDPQPCEHALALVFVLTPPEPPRAIESPPPAPAVLAAAVPQPSPRELATAPLPVTVAPSINSPPPDDAPADEGRAPDPSSEAPSTADPAPPEVARALVWSPDPSDAARVLISGEDGGALPDAAVEALRWFWWRRESATSVSGEARTLPQALQLLHERGLSARGPAIATTLATAGALFHQRALGEAVHVRLLDPRSDGGLALAQLLAHRGARPFPGPAPAQVWTVPDEAAFVAWLHDASLRGARVVPDPSFNPKPLKGVRVLVDSGCLPGRLREADADASPIASEELRASLVRLLSGEPVVDEANGHVLVPVSRLVDVEEGLRALGAAIDYRRLAPTGARYLEWPPEMPEDLHGARPRLREPFRGDLEAAVPNLREGVELAPYQREAVAFILHHGHTCLLADDMGLGKTLESVAAAQFVDGRVLVVAPASARDVWRREVEKFTTERAVVVGPGDDPAALLSEPAKYVVTGYSNLEALAPLLTPEAFALVILDESHYVKNAATGRAKLVREKLLGVPRRLVVSGTPVMNAPEEMRGQLMFLHPEEWSDGAWFERRFVEPFREGAPEVREAVVKRLRQFLEGVMIRREKATALPDLPPKRLEWHRVALLGESHLAYVAQEEEFSAFVRAEGVKSLEGAKASGKLERLKQAALAGKMGEALAFVRALLDGGEKVVVFSRYRNALKSAAEELAAYGPVVLSGDTDGEGRAEAARRFQEDDACRVFLGQLVAAGTALTLTAGTHAVFLDLDWNPANHRQAMDRIHRRGQTKPVTAHFFLALGTVDEDIAETLEEKGRMMDALLSPTEAPRADARSAKRVVGERILARRGEAPATRSE